MIPKSGHRFSEKITPSKSGMLLPRARRIEATAMTPCDFSVRR
jgi:hypothetical protein